jgi:hypothetical protein
MDKEILVELIRISPTLIWTLLVVLLLLAYRKPIGNMLSRLGKVKAFGVEAEFQEAREQLIKASQTYDAKWDEMELRSLIDRADRIRDWLDGSRVLWVDDLYLANANIFRFLNSYGVVIDTVKTTEEALTALKWAGSAYEVVVSDMIRGDDPLAGIHLIEEMMRESIRKPVIFLVLQLDRSRGTPMGAVAITDNPLTLLHNILNVVESKPRMMT